MELKDAVEHVKSHVSGELEKTTKTQRTTLIVGVAVIVIAIIGSAIWG